MLKFTRLYSISSIYITIYKDCIRHLILILLLNITIKFYNSMSSSHYHEDSTWSEHGQKLVFQKEWTLCIIKLLMHISLKYDLCLNFVKSLKF